MNYLRLDDTATDDGHGDAANSRASLYRVGILFALAVATVVMASGVFLEPSHFWIVLTFELLMLSVFYRNARSVLLLTVVYTICFAAIGVSFQVPWQRSYPTTTMCANALRSIAQALAQYAETHGHFPPSIIRDAAGRPLYSWRVELLPFLEQPGLYERFHRDEPWDSPHNKSLLKEYSLFHCPADGGPLEMTSYVAIVGEHGILQRDRPTTIEECTDGLGNTIMLVECSGSGIAWSEPRDLEFDTLPMQINAPHQCGIRSNHNCGVNVVFGDTHIVYLADGIAPDVLRAMLTRDGVAAFGERIHPQ